MDISSLNNGLMNQYANVSNTPSTELNQALNVKTDHATDEELMSACKQFEQYFVEQMYKEMKKTVPKDELLGDNTTYNTFEDMQTEAYAQKIVDSGGIGIAKQLYEQMKQGS